MDINEIFSDKALKQKEKTEKISQNIIDEKISVNELLSFANIAKDAEKGTCVEALEYASGKDPKIVNKKCFEFLVKNLTSKAPRIKWECAKVIGNTVHMFKNELDEAIKNLLENTNYEGTVVRWSTAFALGEIIKLKTEYNKDLIPKINKICETEEKNSIKKMYMDALKKIE